ncbi:formyltetrahydrofolate deformylase, partial [Musa troglodytarum]
NLSPLLSRGRLLCNSGGWEKVLLEAIIPRTPNHMTRQLLRREEQASVVVLDLMARRAISTITGGPARSVLGIHVFHCPDVVGIVAKLSECIASRGGNIRSVDVFVPENKQEFYSRRWGFVFVFCEFVFDPTYWPRDVVDNDFIKLSKLFSAEKSIVRVPDLDPKYKIVILASKQEHCLVDLLYKWQEGRLPVDISCVISNHQRAPNTHVIRFLERHGIPYHYLPTSAGNKREAEILELAEDTDFLVLARYMQILSGRFLESYGKDIINIHHGLLPSFKGGSPSKQAFDAGVKLIGATSHFVSQELDAGPIIEQMGNPFYDKLGFIFHYLDILLLLPLPHLLPPDIVIAVEIPKVERVSHRDTLQSFVQKSENLEKQCLVQAIKSYCELRVLPYQENKTLVF